MQRGERVTLNWNSSFGSRDYQQRFIQLLAAAWSAASDGLVWSLVLVLPSPLIRKRRLAGDSKYPVLC